MTVTSGFVSGFQWVRGFTRKKYFCKASFGLSPAEVGKSTYCGSGTQRSHRLCTGYSSAEPVKQGLNLLVNLAPGREEGDEGTRSCWSGPSARCGGLGSPSRTGTGDSRRGRCREIRRPG